ncbi:minor capsid protein [Paenibacillus xylanexedens]|uniref:SPP1 gp7 family putative phage head morphogenesis protein n=1 Tax=Paenibacillus xylanexedens TaxID=528191 RepID=A0ABS4RW86_PAEXY|nr:minor capsid protein [Paenibacillus xylanexedens]MBP2247134.1 SPP1 gp7 family putative phage head morphogenesis protein [Paenibacillus xylanexedens]
MKPQKYWQKRSEQAAQHQYDKTDGYINAVSREYELAIRSMTKDLNEWYYRFAKNNELSFADGKLLLTKGELKEFRMTLEEFTAMAKGNLDGAWTKELNNVYFKTRIDRLSALLIQLQQQIEVLAANQQTGASVLMQGVYTDTYYRTIYEVHKGLGIGVSFAAVDTVAVAKVVAQPWLGKNYSTRIWDDRDKLAREVRNTVSQGLIRGDGIEQMTRALSARMEVAKHSAERVIRTESAHIIQEATFDGYKSSGLVGQYQVLATLDKRTSKICQGMDLKIFKLSEKETGVTAPPFHPNCRTTTTVYFEDDDDPGIRIARDASGKNIEVPGSMTYAEWKKEYGVEIPEIKAVAKQSKGKASQSGRQLEFTEYDIID